MLQIVRWDYEMAVAGAGNKKAVLISASLRGPERGNVADMEEAQ